MMRAWPVPRCSACRTKLTPVCSVAARTRSASWPMMAKTSVAGTMRTAARITCSSRGFPPTSCNTLGSCDLSLVPLPAAIMATATRGAPARTEALPFDFVFFIGFKYIAPAKRWLFSASSPRIPPRYKSRHELQPRHHEEEDMPKYVIERDIPNVGDVTPDQVIA